MRGCWLAIEHILRQTLSPLCYAYNCTCLLQLLLLFFSNFWLNSNYLQCRPARGVQGKQEHFIILVYSMDLCFYFTWQEEEQKIKRAALGFDLSFFHFKCPETLTLFRLWYSDFQHFNFNVVAYHYDKKTLPLRERRESAVHVARPSFGVDIFKHKVLLNLDCREVDWCCNWFKADFC